MTSKTDLNALDANTVLRSTARCTVALSTHHRTKSAYKVTDVAVYITKYIGTSQLLSSQRIYMAVLQTAQLHNRKNGLPVTSLSRGIMPASQLLQHLYNAGNGLHARRFPHARVGSRNLAGKHEAPTAHEWLHTMAPHTILCLRADRHCCGGDDSQATAALQLKWHLGWKTGAAAALEAASRRRTQPRPALASGPSPAAAPGAAPASAPAAWRCSAHATAQM